MSDQDQPTEPVLPTLTQLDTARARIHHSLPARPLGVVATTSHIENDLAPGFWSSAHNPRFYGFVTGGVTPAALAADQLVSRYDQNVSVHLPRESAATDVEAAALEMLCELLGFENGGRWEHATFTTGATASNVLGLACGREWVVASAAERRRGGVGGKGSVSEEGVVDAMREAGLERVQVLTSMPHSSLRKAAAVVGLGRSCVKDVGRKGQEHAFDFEKLETELKKEGVGSIVCVSCGEVNTGLFATRGEEEMRKLRGLADRYGAWIHVDGAFGIMARVLPEIEEFAAVRMGVDGMEMADSITGDCHKLLNVPYDAGFFLSRSLPLATSVFQNTSAAYLATDSASIPSPLNIRLENSSRFRALPIYANLVAYGSQGFSDMLVSQVRLARRIAAYLQESGEYELLPRAANPNAKDRLEDIFMIVLFRARDAQRNKNLVDAIKATRRIYVSPTLWDGEPAARFAVAHWDASVERDWETIRAVLQEVVR